MNDAKNKAIHAKARFIKTPGGVGRVKSPGDHAPSHSEVMKNGGYGKK